MDKKLIKIIAESPHASEAIEKYVDFLYFKEIIAFVSLFTFLGIVGFLFWRAIEKANTTP